MSSFKSIRSIAEDQAGQILKFLIQDRFNNIEKIKRVTCPTFLVHGMKDNLIPFSHSKELHKACGGPCSLILPANMDHNDFDFTEDLITPFYHFLRQCQISTKEPLSAIKQTKMPNEYFVIPKAYQWKSVPFSFSCYCIQPMINANPRPSSQAPGDGPSTTYNLSNASMNEKALTGGPQPRSSQNKGAHQVLDMRYLK